MPNAATLANLIERTVTGPMWHGPSLSEVLVGISPEAASARPIPGAHSIWELVIHVAVWAEIARARIHGDALGSPPPEYDWPTVPAPSAIAWSAAIERVHESYQALARDVAALSDEELNQSVRLSIPPHSVSTLLHGVIEHGTYHGGQIAVLKRALATAPTPAA
ncbi:MAG: DinB family protein [Gemmatimonadota bacterium]|nr:DinB family protein [Gemmatimonadota bacterium]